MCPTIPAVINGILGMYMWVSVPDSPEDRGIETEESLLRKAKFVKQSKVLAHKTKIFKNLRAGLDVTTGVTHKDIRFNPKAIRAQEMYGEMDVLSGEWTTGVFAAI